jgi:hypothetical protein
MRKSKEIVFLKSFIDNLDLALDILEARTMPVKENIEFMLKKHPYLEGLFHWQIAIIVGTSRESVGRFMGKYYPRNKKKEKGKKK